MGYDLKLTDHELEEMYNEGVKNGFWGPSVLCSKHGVSWNTMCVQCFYERNEEEKEEYRANKRFWQFWKWGLP